MSHGNPQRWSELLDGARRAAREPGAAYGFVGLVLRRSVTARRMTSAVVETIERTPALAERLGADLDRLARR
jgi:hypothetical protein